MDEVAEWREKNERNARVQARYDALMAGGKHGHYETLFKIVREEVEAERARLLAGRVAAAIETGATMEPVARDENA